MNRKHKLVLIINERGKMIVAKQERLKFSRRRKRQIISVPGMVLNNVLMHVALCACSTFI
jgi:hypothetical protein